jgi:phospholipase C
MKRIPVLLAALAGLSILAASVALASPPRAHDTHSFDLASTRSPIRHVIEIFGENVSFDHYYGTYPHAANSDGQPFNPLPHTPAVDGLPPATSSSLPPSLRHSSNLLTANPNASPPMRLDSNVTGLAGDAGGQLTCDQDHNYSDEQQAFDNGQMDRFVQSAGSGAGNTPFGAPCSKNTVMDYYDGNTVTALWNYAQHYAMSDNSYNADITPDGHGGFSLTGDAQPYWDDCSTRDAVGLTGENIGDELNAAGLSWGWFQGGFRPTTSYAAALEATAHAGQPTSTFIPDEFKNAGFQALVPHSANQGTCDAVSPVGQALGGTGQYGYKDDYIPHHEPFQYYESTANPHHLTIPTYANGQDTQAGLETIGTDTQSYAGGVPQFNTPNHNYDMSDFDQLVTAISNEELPPSALPAVSFLKAPGIQDGHAAYSDPADEQQFVAHTINEIMRTPDWRHTAIVINYDDSDGWYDHANPGVINPSLSPADNLTDTALTLPTSGRCGPDPQKAPSLPLAGQQGRCGFGPRLPMLVISPFAKRDYVDHDLSDQASTIDFVEYNWHLPGIAGSFDQALGKTDKAEHVPFDLAGMFDFDSEHGNDALPLSPVTGQPVGGPSGHH